MKQFGWILALLVVLVLLLAMKVKGRSPDAASHHG